MVLWFVVFGDPQWGASITYRVTIQLCVAPKDFSGGRIQAFAQGSNPDLPSQKQIGPFARRSCFTRRDADAARLT
jgi:hypothetical protein